VLGVRINQNFARNNDQDHCEGFCHEKFVAESTNILKICSEEKKNLYLTHNVL
jgi:hypothetical protein